MIKVLIADDSMFFRHTLRSIFEADPLISLVGERVWRVLVVDDSKAQRESLGAAIKNGGHSVLYAADGEEALDMLTDIDLVVTDLEMPNIDGCKLTRVIKNIPPTSSGFHAHKL